MPHLSSAQRRVLAELAEPRRAQDIAKLLGVDPSAVRRHLENLISMGLVATRDVRTGPGRPKRFYELTDIGRETGPRNYPLLLALVMKKVSDGEGRKKLLGYLESIAADLAGPPANQQDAKVRLDVLLAKYNELGFEAEIQEQGGETLLIQRNCPFLAAARSDPHGFCQVFDEGMIRAALPGSAVDLRSSLAHDDTHCSHVIRARRAAPAARKARRRPA